uniref:Uncharacterized protein n=1 Tax=Oryza glumipatula TaxID=40148 RepID=A0A0D9YKC5_9ORYZ
MASPSLPPLPPPFPGIMEVYRNLPPHFTVECKVSESGQRAVDMFDGSDMKLHCCAYKVGPIEAQRMLKKGSATKLASSYLFLSSFCHPAACSVENYMISGALVVSCVDGTFRKWLMNTPVTDLISPEGHLLPLLRDMITSLVGLVESLLNHGKYIENLTINDLYIKYTCGHQPKLQVLLHENVQSVTEVKPDEIWGNVRNIVERCFTICKISPHESAMMFGSFIGRGEVSVLHGYPDIWDEDSKSAFLIDLCSDIGMMSKINGSGVQWPEESKGVVEPLLTSIIAATSNRAIYNTTIPWDYIRLCKNTYKHFDELPDQLKDVLEDCNGIIRKMDEWKSDPVIEPRTEVI